MTDIPNTATNRDVSVYFSQCGKILDVSVVPAGQDSMAAFVHFATAEEVQSALLMSGKRFLDSCITVIEKKEPPMQASSPSAVATTSLHEISRPVVEESKRDTIKVEPPPIKVEPDVQKVEKVVFLLFLRAK